MSRSSIFAHFFILALFLPAHAQTCDGMMTYDYSMGMCMPLAMAGMSMRMLMLQGNGFLTQTTEERPRGRDGTAAPNMVMADLGSSLGDRQYLNVDLMATAERWTYPRDGYPELLQIGESKQDGSPFIDAQHPHSSPIMGLTLSDTIALGEGSDHLKVWIAPRGESGDGPIAFMHRPTGMVNPDAPLGHHVGQDVGHISSSVVGTGLHLDSHTFEASTFHGAEPQPTAVDLPLGTLDSYSARVIEQFSPRWFAMASVAYVKNPEPTDPDTDHLWRYSASAYGETSLRDDWNLHQAFIYGLINGYDHAAALNSFAIEEWLHKGARHFWGRVEELQRTPAELLLTANGDPNGGEWVTALTLGSTYDIMKTELGQLGVGASITKDILPTDMHAAYGSDPLSGKIFLQARGMKMYDY